jgi:hypothetical protein
MASGWRLRLPKPSYPRRAPRLGQQLAGRSALGKALGQMARGKAALTAARSAP